MKRSGLRVFSLLLAFTLVLPLAPGRADAWVFALFARALGSGVARAVSSGAIRVLGRNAVRSGFRHLARGAGRRLIRTRVTRAMRQVGRRRVAFSQGRSRMLQLFGKKPLVRRGARGQVLRSAVVEGDELVFREGARKLGFAQWENEGLALYAVDGRRLARLKPTDGRIMAYDTAGKYLGQFVEQVVNKGVERFFVDAQGRRMESMPVTVGAKGDDVSDSKRFESYDEQGRLAGYSRLEDGMLAIYDATCGKLGYGAWEGDSLVVYDVVGNKQGEFRKRGDVIVAFDDQGKETGRIVTEQGRAVFKPLPVKA